MQAAEGSYEVIPIVSIVGRSNSGKTTVLEGIIRELVARGYRVAAVKHDVHGFEIDREGKDSWRLKQAGAHTVLISSPRKLAVIEDVDRDLALEEIRRRVHPATDIILTEGYKRQPFPKIEVSVFGDSSELLCTRSDNLIACVASRPVAVDVPVFSETGIAALCDFIETRFLAHNTRHVVEIWNDGARIALNPFVERLIQKTLQGLLSTLKGASSLGEVEIRLHHGNNQERSESDPVE